MNINYDTDIIYDIDVDFYSRNHFDTVYAKQYDENNRWIRATVWKNGEVYTIPTNAIAVFTCTKRDGYGIYNECQIVNNQILYPISLQTTILDGNINAEFRLYSTIDNGDGTNTSKLISSPKFKMHIEESALKDDTVISSSEFNALTAAMNNVGDLTTDVNNAIARANTAISNAETATLNANTATTNANNATSLANTATTNANNAANLADTATTNANTATANAITATNNANTATTNANNAATNANNKAGLANTAATNANNVATQLETETLKIFKPAVSTYADLSTTYPTPENGWTVTVNGENPVVSYRYNGTEWVNLGVISSVDKATNTSLGIVKGGGNVNIDVNGVLSVPEIGDLSQLNTTSNTDLVGAVNELELDKLEKNGDTKDNIATFEDYSSTTPPSAEIALGNIVTGNKLSSLFSNIKAFCKGVITLGRLANNLSTTSEGLALDARQGKVLNDSISMINSNLAYQTLQFAPEQLLNGWSSTLAYPVKLIKWGRTVCIYLNSLSGTANNMICDLNSLLPGLYAYDRENTGIYIDNGNLYLSKNSITQDVVFTFAF